MNAWPGEDGDVMGPTVTRAASAKPTAPPLKNGTDLRESGYLISVGSRTSRLKRKYKKRIPYVIILMIFFLLLIAFVIMIILYTMALHRMPATLCKSPECLRSAANLALSMDRTAEPCDDFYKYVCGNWGNEHPRPDAYSSYDWFRDKQSKVYVVVRDFLTKNITGDVPKPVQQAQDMYNGCLDTATIDKVGLKPVVGILEALGLPPYPTYINATQDFNYTSYNFDWLETVVKIKTQLGMDVFIGFDIFTDPKNSSVYRLVMGSPETINPFPSIHTKSKHHRSDDIRWKNPLKRLKSHIIYNIGQQHPKTDSENESDKLAQVHKVFYAQLIKLLFVETEGSKHSKLSEVELDENALEAAGEHFDISSDLYELEADNSTETEDEDFDIPEYTVQEIQSHTDATVENNNYTASPIWKRYLEGIFAISDVVLDFETDKVLISEPDLKYMSLMAAYVAKTPPVLLELYIWLKVVETTAAHTTTELRAIFKHVYNPGNTQEATSHSLQCANIVNSMMGMAVSYGIADPYFMNMTKPRVITMIDELKDSLAHLVGQTKWMDDDTQLATFRKIIDMKALIGFPEWLLEPGKLEEYYEGIEIDTKKHLNNMVNVIQVKMKVALNKFRYHNNFTWASDPTEVNAYHTFQENTITVPLVMLQYPFYNLGLDSLNYGSLGAVLGHEITHGFDNFGRQFDKNGNLLPWWSNNTIRSYVNTTQCFIEQYSSYYFPELDEHVNGKKTLGENIADNGGLREALAAYKHHQKKHSPELKLPGFEHMSSEQLFFLSYGNLWCGISTTESLKSDLEDEHSPIYFRARGALQNNEDFAKAWHCPIGSTMNPKKRCIIF